MARSGHCASMPADGATCARVDRPVGEENVATPPPGRGVGVRVRAPQANRSGNATPRHCPVQITKRFGPPDRAGSMSRLCRGLSRWQRLQSFPASIRRPSWGEKVARSAGYGYGCNGDIPAGHRSRHRLMRRHIATNHRQRRHREPALNASTQSLRTRWDESPRSPRSPAWSRPSLPPPQSLAAFRRRSHPAGARRPPVLLRPRTPA